MKKQNSTYPCPYCGMEISQNAKACRYCGSDDTTGWSDQNYVNLIGLPDEIDYDDLCKKEFGNTSNKKVFLNSYAIIAAVVIVIAIGLMLKAFF